METNNDESFSIQVQLIRKMQEKEGKDPCYATPVAAHCNEQTREQCSWHHDCFHEAEDRLLWVGNGSESTGG